jgi:hypothetical protein
MFITIVSLLISLTMVAVRMQVCEDYASEYAGQMDGGWRMVAGWWEHR